MYYERPKKKPRRPADSKEALRPGFFTTLTARRRAREFEAEEALEIERLKEKRRNHSLLRAVFSPKENAEDESDGYVSDEPADDGRRHPLLRLTAAFLILVFLAAGLLYLLPVGVFGSHDRARYLANGDLPSGCAHVLLMGIDRDAGGTSRTDTMMVLSVGRGCVYLTSLQRDTGVTIPGKSGSHRLNAAYSYGGAELALQTVNQNFGLNLTRYALVDYDSFPELIDLIGGVTVSVTDAEARQIDNNMREVLLRAYKTGQATYEDALGRYQSEFMDEGGENLTLTGMQALGYARIRNLDSDYGRTNRQRKVLSAAIRQLKTLIKRPAQLVNFTVRALGMVETNMNALEIISLGEKALLTKSIDQMRLPVNGTYSDDGGMFYNVNFEANRKAFVEFVYGSAE